MDTPILHLIGPCRDGSPAMIAGDVVALTRLRAAIDAAIANSIGMAELFSSDYEPYDLLVVAPPNMWNVCTVYAGEINPVRSQRETVTLTQLWNLHNKRQHYATANQPCEASRLDVPAEHQPAA
ncbi:hypothetical protein ASF61_21505 [Duganella sp. Leaf126]|uniref:hypothetical protein n=1 Tax=Duganella sp. Leaf126 TaxID=1736266 RepID=UPI0006F9BCF3|nr:hypothetical protein [Duganella sp. Leaf126]KQQ44708.1 hypothetical protein ASF61_21505 [Duganella sp. Leaf126]